MMKEMIRQLLPVSELLSPMILMSGKDGKHYYADATASGWAVFFALRDDEEFGSYTEMYLIDGHECIGELEKDVRLVPTVYCRGCGRRMFAGTSPEDPDHVVYRCLCGETLDSAVIANITEA